MSDDQTSLMHATCVAAAGRGVLITGASGSGKSALALQLLAFGAELVADDQVALQLDGGLVATAPSPIRGKIEARGVGILQARTTLRTQIVLAVDMDQCEAARLPPLRHITLLRCAIPLLYRVEGIHFAPAILQILREGRSDPHG